MNKTLEMPLPVLPEELSQFKPEVGLVLGSGLGFFADERVEVVGRIDYSSIDGFPVSTVEGHAGRFVYGTVGERRVVCMQGRFHFYEGYSLRELTQPIRLMAGMGVQTVILTNAAGGINPDFVPGDLMLLEDHINFLGTNALIGPIADGEVRFPDMSAVYDPELRAKVLEWATARQLNLKTGVYLATTGPSYETPAEVRMFGSWGADAVGMSTVPEAVVAKQVGLRVLGFSCITNAAAGISNDPLSHEEVAETAEKVKAKFADLVAAAIRFA